MDTSKKKQPRYFWHNIGVRDKGWSGTLSPSQKNEWWQWLLHEGKVSAGYDDNKPGYGEQLLKSYEQGDRIIAYANRWGALGWGIVESPAYRTEAPFLTRSHRHFLQGIIWKDFAEKIEDSVRISIIKSRFNISQPRTTKVRIDDRKAELLIQELKLKFRAGSSAGGEQQRVKTRQESLMEDAYPRASPKTLKIIIPRHNKLSNSFCGWLKRHYGIEGIQEKNRIDIHFRYKTKTVIAELKVCYGVEARHSVRDALGQLLEYNHYPKRSACDSWLIVLDTKPSADDLTFIGTLRDKLSLPIWIGWQAKAAFSFCPKWL